MKKFIKKPLLKLYYLFLDFKKRYTVLKNQFISVVIKPPIVKNTDKTLEKILNDKCSVSRYGDGEFKIMFKGEQFFQEYNEELRLRLIEIIKSDSHNHIVCIPDVFDNVDRFTAQAKSFWTNFILANRSKIYQKLNKKKVYFDAMVTRLYLDYIDKSKAEERFNQFKMIWDHRDIILVEGELSRLGAGNNLFSNAKSLKRILCPAENAFAKYKEILSEVKKYDQSNLILLSLGPTATVLAYDLSQLGYEAVDIGNVDIEYEWFLNRTLVKIPVKHKYTGEVANGKNVERLDSQEYEEEIQVQIL